MEKLKANRNAGTVELWSAVDAINGTNRVYYANEENEWSDSALVSWVESELLRWKKRVGDEPKLLTYADNHWFDEDDERKDTLREIGQRWFRPHTDSYYVYEDEIHYGLKRFRETLGVIINNCMSDRTTIIGSTVNNVNYDKHVRVFEVFQDVTGFYEVTNSTLLKPNGEVEKFNWQGEKLQLHKADMCLPSGIKDWRFVTPAMYKEIIALVKREGDWFSEQIHDINTKVALQNIKIEAEYFERHVVVLNERVKATKDAKKGLKKKITAYNKKVKVGLEIAALIDEFYADEQQWFIDRTKAEYISPSGCPKRALEVAQGELKEALDMVKSRSRKLIDLAPIEGNNIVNKTFKEQLGIEGLWGYYEDIKGLL